MEDILSKGIKAAKTGNLVLGRVLLIQSVREDPNSEEGWFWLGKCLDEPDRRVHCFRRVLALNPSNDDAELELQEALISEAAARLQTEQVAEFQPGPPEPPLQEPLYPTEAAPEAVITPLAEQVAEFQPGLPEIHLEEPLYPAEAAPEAVITPQVEQEAEFRPRLLKRPFEELLYPSEATPKVVTVPLVEQETEFQPAPSQSYLEELLSPAQAAQEAVAESIAEQKAELQPTSPESRPEEPASLEGTVPEIESALSKGIKAAKAGDLVLGKSLLLLAVRENPDSEQGWFWLGKCLVEPDRRIYCFRRVLTLNSLNKDAELELRQALIYEVVAALKAEQVAEAQPGPPESHLEEPVQPAQVAPEPVSALRAREEAVIKAGRLESFQEGPVLPTEASHEAVTASLAEKKAEPQPSPPEIHLERPKPPAEAAHEVVTAPLAEKKPEPQPGTPEVHLEEPKPPAEAAHEVVTAPLAEKKPEPQPGPPETHLEEPVYPTEAAPEEVAELSVYQTVELQPIVPESRLEEPVSPTEDLTEMKDLLSHGVEAAKAGDLLLGRSLLLQAVRENPDSEEGWLWLGKCLEELHLRIFCFRRVLALNPLNDDAEQELRQALAPEPVAAPEAEQEPESQPGPPESHFEEPTPLPEVAPEPIAPLPVEQEAEFQPTTPETHLEEPTPLQEVAPETVAMLPVEQEALFRPAALESRLEELVQPAQVTPEPALALPVEQEVVFQPVTPEAHIEEPVPPKEVAPEPITPLPVEQEAEFQPTTPEIHLEEPTYPVEAMPEIVEELPAYQAEEFQPFVPESLREEQVQPTEAAPETVAAPLAEQEVEFRPALPQSLLEELAHPAEISPEIENLLNKGIKAAKAGDLLLGKSLLLQAVRENPDSEDGWFWLGKCLEELHLRIFCYRRVLALNPLNYDAEQELRQALIPEPAAALQTERRTEIQPSPPESRLEEPVQPIEAAHEASAALQAEQEAEFQFGVTRRLQKEPFRLTEAASETVIAPQAKREAEFQPVPPESRVVEPAHPVVAAPEMEDLLIKGIKAAKAGDRVLGRTLLTRAVRENPESEEGWFWYGKCLDEPYWRTYCFRRVLDLNPLNKDAEQELQQALAPEPVAVLQTEQEAEIQPSPPERQPEELERPAEAAPEPVAAPPIEQEAVFQRATPETHLEEPTPLPEVAPEPFAALPVDQEAVFQPAAPETHLEEPVQPTEAAPEPVPTFPVYQAAEFLPTTPETHLEEPVQPMEAAPEPVPALPVEQETEFPPITPETYIEKPVPPTEGAPEPVPALPVEWEAVIQPPIPETHLEEPVQPMEGAPEPVPAPPVEWEAVSQPATPETYLEEPAPPLETTPEIVAETLVYQEAEFQPAAPESRLEEPVQPMEAAPEPVPALPVEQEAVFQPPIPETHIEEPVPPTEVAPEPVPAFPVEWEAVFQPATPEIHLEEPAYPIEATVEGIPTLPVYQAAEFQPGPTESRLEEPLTPAKAFSESASIPILPVEQAERLSKPGILPPTPAAWRERWRSNALWAGAGFLFCLLLCGSILSALIFSGKFNQLACQKLARLQVAGAPILGLTPSPTPTSSPTPSPSPIHRPSAIPTLTNTSTKTPVPSTRTPTPTPVTAANYYNDAQSFYDKAQQEHSLLNFQDYLEQARSTIDQAIALGPASGDYYLLRSETYGQLARSQELRVDREYLDSIALDNLRTALAKGNSDGYSNYSIPLLLFDMQRCQEGMAELQQINAERGVSAPPSPGLLTTQANGYLCQGQLENALSYVSRALEIEKSPERGWLRAIILYQLVKKNEALAQLNELLQAQPDYEGERYYLRALIYYDSGKVDLANQDLETGSRNAWLQGGLRSYVLGRMAFAAGDRQAGIEYFQNALATLPWYFRSTLFETTRLKIASRGAKPLPTDLTISATATLMPTLEASPTVQATSRASTPSTAAIPTPPNPIIVNMENGTGVINLKPFDYPVFLFQTPAPIAIRSVESLILNLSSPTETGPTSFKVFIWNPTANLWMMINPVWGATSISKPSRFVDKSGNIYIAVYYPGGQSGRIENIWLTLAATARDGTSIAIDLKK